MHAIKPSVSSSPCGVTECFYQRPNFVVRKGPRHSAGLGIDYHRWGKGWKARDPGLASRMAELCKYRRVMRVHDTSYRLQRCNDRIGVHSGLTVGVLAAFVHVAMTSKD